MSGILLVIDFLVIYVDLYVVNDTARVGGKTVGCSFITGRKTTFIISLVVVLFFDHFSCTGLGGCTGPLCVVGLLVLITIVFINASTLKTRH